MSKRANDRKRRANLRSAARKKRASSSPRVRRLRSKKLVTPRTPSPKKLRNEFARTHAGAMDKLKKRDFSALDEAIQAERDLIEQLSDLISDPLNKTRKPGTEKP